MMSPELSKALQDILMAGNDLFHATASIPLTMQAQIARNRYGQARDEMNRLCLEKPG